MNLKIIGIGILLSPIITKFLIIPHFNLFESVVLILLYHIIIILVSISWEIDNLLED